MDCAGTPWTWNSFLPSSSHPAHTARELPESSSTHPTFLNHRSLLPDSCLLPPAFVVSKEGLPDSCQHQVLSLPKVHKQGTKGVASGTLRAEEGQDGRMSCTTPYTSKLISALLEEPFNVSTFNVPTEQPSGKVRGHPCDLAVSSNFSLFMGHGLVVSTLYQTLRRAEGKCTPQRVVKAKRNLFIPSAPLSPLKQSKALLPSSSGH